MLVPNPTILRLNGHTYPISEWEKKILGPLGGRIIAVEGDSEEAIPYGAVDAVLVVSGRLDGGIIRQLRRCRVISRYGTGTDRIDVEEATRQGIIVTHLRGFCCQEVADHAMAMLLMAARKLGFYDRQMRAGVRPVWDLDHLHRLSACTLGIVGFGQIGQHIARRARGFGMRIVAYDPHFDEEGGRYWGVERMELASVLGMSDYLVLACPLLPETRSLIGWDQLRAMKRSAVLINVARGGVVKEDDLVRALRETAIRFAALDVFADINVFGEEGFPTNHPLFSLSNVLLTPHVAATSQESRREMFMQGARNAADVLRGVLPDSIVNPEVKPWFWQGPKRDTAVREVLTK